MSEKYFPSHKDGHDINVKFNWLCNKRRFKKFKC